METQIKKEIKYLLVIGGLPCLATLIGFVLAFNIYPEDGYRGMFLIGLFAFVTTVISIVLIIRNINSNLGNK